MTIPRNGGDRMHERLSERERRLLKTLTTQGYNVVINGEVVYNFPTMAQAVQCYNSIEAVPGVRMSIKRAK